MYYGIVDYCGKFLYLVYKDRKELDRSFKGDFILIAPDVYYVKNSFADANYWYFSTNQSLLLEIFIEKEIKNKYSLTVLLEAIDNSKIYHQLRHTIKFWEEFIREFILKHQKNSIENLDYTNTENLDIL